MTREMLDSFECHYVACMLWSSTDDDGNPLDSEYDSRQLSDSAIDRIKKDCREFQDKAGELLNAENCLIRIPAEEQAAHDFWLTRNGHGCGFWEKSDWAEDAGEKLTAIAKSFGEQNVYVGDDGELHIM